VYKGKKIIAVVPARGGSKGIPLKNIQKINGVPLVGWVAKLIKELSFVDRAVVSTDHSKIASVCESYGLSAPFIRPVEISGDSISDLEVLAHAVLEMEKQDGVKYDVVLMLQPTSPLRTVDHVMATTKKLIDEDLDSVWTVSPTESKAHPLKQLTLTDNKLDYYDPNGADIIARQQLKTVYHRNGIAYAFTRSCLLEGKSIMGKRSGALVIKDKAVSIDTREDMGHVEWILNHPAGNK